MNDEYGNRYAESEDDGVRHEDIHSHGEQVYGGPPPLPEDNDAYVITQEERTLGMFCHILTFAGLFFPFGNIIGPLILWLIKKDEAPFVDDQGKEALNFQITMSIATIVCIPLVFIIIGIPLLIALVITDLVLTIKAAIRANEGEWYRYPVSIRFMK